MEWIGAQWIGGVSGVLWSGVDQVECCGAEWIGGVEWTGAEWSGREKWTGLEWSGAEWISGMDRSREEPSGSIEWRGVVVYWTDLKNRNNKY